jgi:hypothetical protein
LAQLTRYFQYPAGRVGTNAFTDYVNGTATQLRLRGGDGKGGPYAWSEMPLDPANPAATTNQCQAIGALTHDCAVAVNMDFAPGGSGADDARVETALTNTFKYGNARYAIPDGTTFAGTNLLAIINPNLDARLPVIFGIESANGSDGHEIVCDGYGYDAGTAYHHLNMGWGGVDNAWYALPVINATESGQDFSIIDACTYNVYTNGSGEIISGRLVNISNAPLRGVTVTATNATGERYSATTDTNGIFAFLKVPPNTHFTLTVTQGAVKAAMFCSTGLSVDYASASGNVWAGDFVFVPAPVLTWATPAPIKYGTPLGGAQLNATANVPGTFIYFPPPGTNLPAGVGQLLAATFTPADPVHHSAAEASVTIDVTNALLEVTGLAVSNKVYNGSTAAIVRTNAAKLAGVIGQDKVFLGGAVAGTFADKNVGAGKAVTVSGLSLSGAQAGNYSLTLPFLAASITPAALAVGGLAASNKVYNGTTVAGVNTNAATLAGVIGQDKVSLGGAAAGTFADKNAGTNKPVTLNGLSLSGAGSGNYALTLPVLTASITPAPLTLGGLAASNKVYNGTASATINTNGAKLAGVNGQDPVYLAGAATGAFANKNVGTNKPVAVSGLVLAGASAANYSLALPTLAANIAPAVLTVSGVTAANKVYDGTTAATVKTAAAALVGAEPVDAGEVTLLTSGATGSFATPGIGANKTVTISGLGLGGGAAPNYALLEPVTTASITGPVFAISNPVITGTVFGVSVPTLTGLSYVLEYKNTLGDSGWREVSTLPGTGGPAMLSDENAGVATRFYRVRVE